jgi:hypothetical protein
MSTSALPMSPRLFWEAASTPGEVQVRLGPRYQGQFGFRRLLLAETLLGLMLQQLPPGPWRLRSAVLKFIRNPAPQPAALQTVQRPVFPSSLLANVRLIQQGQVLATLVGAFDREWRPPTGVFRAPPAFDAPQRLPLLQNWPEDAENECRDASGQLWTSSKLQQLGGFVRRRNAQSFAPEGVPTLLEPWLSMPDPKGDWREVTELVLEMLDPGPSTASVASDYYQVLLERSDWSEQTERLVASIWTRSKNPVASAYVSTCLTN